MKRIVFGITLTLLFIGMLALRLNVQPVKADKPLAPNGVHGMTTYEDRIGEQGLLIEDDNIQMWVPASYENHSRIIFDYLAAGYANLSSIFGDHDYPYKFSVEHYPEGSPYEWGGTDAEGTIRYGYSNLEDDTDEWNLYQVPHMSGYYEEMAHSFVLDFGVWGHGWYRGGSVGFYETLGLMIGGCEVTLRAAYNPYSNDSISNYYQVCNEATSYYLQHNAGPPDLGKNIWPTRVLTHIFKVEVVDVYGWDAFTDAFNYLRQKGNPLKECYRDHTWGGFLCALGCQTGSDFPSIFGSYGLPRLEWFEEDGYEKGMLQISDNDYSFRVKCFDREGDQPNNLTLHVYYPTTRSKYPMNSIGGNNNTGWTFETDMTLAVNFTYAFSGRDSRHSIWQAVGPPTWVDVELPHDVAITDVSSKSVVIQNYSVSIDVTVENQGSFEENFNVTVYANTTTIEQQEVSLTGRSWRILTFMWNTTGFGIGNYTISAYAEPVPGETDLSANNSTGGWIFVTIQGDVDGDRDVDIYDVVKITGIYNSKRGDPQFNPNSDLDDDGEIRIYDVIMCTSHYGQSW